MTKLTRMRNTIRYTYREEGAYWVARKALNIVKRSLGEKTRFFADSISSFRDSDDNSFYDVMFINGCHYSLPHPIRYRVDHQMEQLISAGYSVGMTEASDVSDDCARHARLFIVYRCPYTEAIGSFIAKAKKLNKCVLYDIDDLVIDVKYTNQVSYVQSMSPGDKALYDDGVERMGKTLSMCDGAITTTEALAAELAHYVPKVYINRNTASDAMLYLSEDAVFCRDVLPWMSAASIPPHKKKMQKVWRDRFTQKQKESEVVIGYFSGSITHNDDFNMVLPALVSLMRRNSNVRLLVGGELSLPAELEEFRSRVDFFSFYSWQRLPYLIAKCDINIAPLEDTLFNRAKSENKWVEAALLKIPTVASNVGAFASEIEHGETGFLCETLGQWEEVLTELVRSPSLRKRIGDQAFEVCQSTHTTLRTALNIGNIVESCLTENIAFVMPGLETSGGVLVAIKHGCFLQECGYDVTFIDVDGSRKWLEYGDRVFPVLDRGVLSGDIDECPFTGSFDKGVATLWDTLDFLTRYPRFGRLFYLVQGMELDFLQPGEPLRRKINSTYCQFPKVEYRTISTWCKDWLENDYGAKCKYAPNGLDVDRFYPVSRDFGESKIRILVEGDCFSKCKNVDEAFEVTNRLDPNRYEVWYMSNEGKSKPFYRVDRHLGKVPQQDVPDIYRKCHILLKTSISESFSYPPLEMMSTGGFVVAIPNEGNVEYLRNGENCLLFPRGDAAAGVAAIERLSSDGMMRDRLFEAGLKTAMTRNWDYVKDEIVDLYA